MRTRLMTVTMTAAALAATLTLNAQQTPNPQTQPQGDRQREGAMGANASEQSITVTGCLRAEKDVPGRSQSVTERAGIGEDYVLTNVKMAQGASTSGIGLATMYQIKGGSVRETELKNHLGHQVEVVGRIENMHGSRMTGTTADRGTGTGRPATGTGTTGTGTTTGTTGTGTAGTGSTARSGNTAGNNTGDNLPNFEATSLKMISATCPAQ